MSAYDACASRHLDNIGQRRPQAAWTLSYGCRNDHTVTTMVCDRCASSLVDGRQRCAQCVAPMAVTYLAATPANGDSGASS